MEEIVALICLLCILVALILFGIFLPIKDYISKKRFYKDVELGSVYKYYGCCHGKNPFKRVLYYIQIIDKKDGYFQYKTYRSFDAIAKDDYININGAYLNPCYLSNLLNILGGDDDITVKYAGDLRPLLLENNNGCAIIVPVRMS